MNSQPPTPNPPGPANGLPQLLERAPQLAELRQAVRDVAGGSSATVVVHGQPGSGRSALLAEAAVITRQAGLRVVTLTCRPDDRRPRQGVVRDALTAAALLAPGEPLAVLVDDAHWADPRAVRRARAIMRRPAARPLLLVAAGHDPAFLAEDDSAAGDATGAGTGERRYELALHPLSRNGVRTLLVAAYGDRSCGFLVPGAFTTTGGNPALLRATLRRCPAPAPTTDELEAVADRVGREQVRRVLDVLPGHVVALLRAGAVGHGDLSFDQAYAVAGIEQPSRERARADLARTGLLDDIDRPRLRDALVAGRVLDLMDNAERRDLYARAVRQGRDDGLAAPVLGRLVAHTRLAEPWVPAILRAAGVHARNAGDHTRAVAFFERALDLGAAGARRTEILLDLSLAQTYVRPEAADRGFQRVLAEATEPGLSACRLIAADLLTLRGGGQAAAAALAVAAGRETVPAAERRTLFGLHLMSSDKPPAADEAPPSADAESVMTQADPAQAAAAAWRHCARGQRIGEAHRLAMTALASAGSATVPLAPGLLAVRILVLAEDMHAASDGLDRIEAEARRRGVRPAVGMAMLGRAELAMRRGDPVRASVLLAKTVSEVPRRHWHPRRLSELTALGVLIDLHSGLIDRAESALAVGVPDGHENGFGWAELLFARGMLDLQTGRLAGATTHLRECGRLLLHAGCLNPAVLPWRSHLALAQVTTRPEATARLLAEELTAAREWGTSGTLGAVHLWSGLATEGPQAVRHLRSAVRVLADSPERSRYAQAMVELAAALLDDGRPADGSQMLSKAMETMRADGGRPTPRADDVAARYASLARTAQIRLTPAQLRVALLAAEGWPNKVIAGALSISLRAVELHLTNTYRTLGIGGRADLAATLGRGDYDPRAHPEVF